MKINTTSTQKKKPTQTPNQTNFSSETYQNESIKETKVSIDPWAVNMVLQFVLADATKGKAAAWEPCVKQNIF